MYDSNFNDNSCSDSEHSKLSHSDICQDIPRASSVSSSVAKQQSIATATVCQQEEVSECQNALISTAKRSPVCRPSSPLITSIVDKTESQTAVSPGKTRGFSAINSPKFCFNKVSAFVPENFDETLLKKHPQEALCLFHTMHLFRVKTRQPKDAWIDLSYEYCMRRFPHWPELKRTL